MTDSNATELKSCPFCGGEAVIKKTHRWPHWAGTEGCDGFTVICTNFDCTIYEADVFYATTEEEAIEAWNTRTPDQAIAATLGAPKLAAEQVRNAVMSADRCEKPMGNTGLTNTHLIIRDDGWQAIADELNATLGADDESRWSELFGTPERTLDTLDVIAEGLYSDAYSDRKAELHDMLCMMVDRCDNCPLQGKSGGGVTTRCRRADEDDVLVWLRGKAVS